MNLFVLDQDPKIAAQYNCDKHISKMILEIAQMTANCFTEEQLKHAPPTQKGTPRKHSYYNHPVSIWIRQSKENFEWALVHAFELENERMHRGYTTPHFSISFLQWCAANINECCVGNAGFTPFAVAIAPDKNCRKISGFDSLDTVEKYRLYYIHDKPFVKWTNRETPYWFNK